MSLLTDDEHRRLLASANRHLVHDDGTYADGVSRVEILDYGHAVEQAVLAAVSRQCELEWDVGHNKYVLAQIGRDTWKALREAEGEKS